MSLTNLRPSSMFHLEGPLLGFLGSDRRRPKSIVIEVEGEQIAIRLAKEVRASLPHLQVGDRILCIGRSQINAKAGVIELKAYQLFSVPAHGESNTADQAPTIEIPAIQHRTASMGQAPAAKIPKTAKILVCHKSGCQKRGGRQVVAALEQTLRQHQLEERVEVHYTGCQKQCSKAPSITIMPGKHRYTRVDPQSISALIEEHFCSPQALV